VLSPVLDFKLCRNATAQLGSTDRIILSVKGSDDGVDTQNYSISGFCPSSDPVIEVSPF
jgi:hypothetical protein